MAPESTVGVRSPIFIGAAVAAPEHVGVCDRSLQTLGSVAERRVLKKVRRSLVSWCRGFHGGEVAAVRVVGPEGGLVGGVHEAADDGGGVAD